MFIPYLHTDPFSHCWWAEKDSNLRTRERTDLQSVAFSHSAIYPSYDARRRSKLNEHHPEPLAGIEPATY